MSEKRVLALIPARAGSQSIPGKNYKKFAGRPLIEHSIKFALGCSDFAETYVSSNDIEIQSIVAQYSTVNFIQRPEDLAKDDSTMAGVIKHCVEYVLKQGKSFDYLVLLDPTSPIRRIKWLHEAISMLDANSDLEGVVSISKPHFNPFWVGVSVNERCLISRIFPEFGRVARRQDAPPFFRVNGSLYCWRLNFAQSMPLDYLSTGKISGIQIPEELALSIDTPEEWDIAELIFKSFHKNLRED